MRPDRVRVYQTEAIVLRHVKLGEADKILTLYSPTVGKFRAVAKGVRRPKSRLGGHVELLARSQLQVAHGQNLDIVTQAQTAESYLGLRDHLPTIGLGVYLADLVDQFTEERLPNPPLYVLLAEALRRLATPGDHELVVRYFELHLLTYLGYRPRLRRCAQCQTTLDPVTNGFRPAAGGAICAGCRQASDRVLPVSRLKVLRAIHSEGWDLVDRLRLTREQHRDVMFLLRGYLIYLLEREPKSLQFLSRLPLEEHMPPSTQRVADSRTAEYVVTERG
ncbi:MAG TPA: DNA repair protein RecO [Dehalococcoidia bacterium]|nr:DNA repair protein RecO [Dehalococcoidia bacterium]